MATKWLNPEEREAWIRLVALVELMPNVFDARLRHDAKLVYFEYYVLAMLSEADDRTLRMSELAAMTNATLPRLSHAVRRLEQRGLVERFPCAEDGRSTNARLTDAGLGLVVETAPKHVTHVRSAIFDALTEEQVAQLSEISGALLQGLAAVSDKQVPPQARLNTATRKLSPSR
ncbi:MarR family winged helix-turn-helix transcriptional regulator [Propionibacteriaceae bacterium G1746]|uniref:MarR family winged helix-turn-helix transcriptional regulator n=1 Tax=Aestuariimicrobium sp. G57 TaxID=3418485 RepID=UPI003C1C6A20